MWCWRMSSFRIVESPRARAWGSRSWEFSWKQISEACSGLLPLSSFQTKLLPDYRGFVRKSRQKWRRFSRFGVEDLVEKLAELTVDASTRGRRGRGTGWRQQGKVEGRDPSSAGLGGQGKVRKKSLAYIMDGWRTKPAQKENHVEGAAP